MKEHLPTHTAGGGHESFLAHEHPSFLDIFKKYYHLLPEWVPNVVIASGIIIVILSVISILLTRNLKLKPDNKSQMFLEIIVNWLYDFTEGVMGPIGKDFAPLIGSFFIYIVLMNAFGLIPGMPGPTSSYNTTIALSLITFLATHYFAIKLTGLKGWLNHLFETGIPWSLYMLPLKLIFFLIHCIGELAKPFSLSTRLMANIFSEETVMLQIIMAIFLFYKFVIPIATYGMLLAVSLITILLQAFIFSILSAVYIAGMLEHHKTNEEHNN